MSYAVRQALALEKREEEQIVFPDASIRTRAGQAMIEFIMVIMVIVLLVSAACEFIPIFTASLRQQTEAHSNMDGITMLEADEGIVKQQSDLFETNSTIPFLLQDGDIRFFETLKFPAANFKTYFNGKINIPGALSGSELFNENDNQTSMFKSWIVSGHPKEIKNLTGLLLDPDWIRYENMTYENLNDSEYVYIYTQGDQFAPAAVAAIYVGPAKSAVPTAPFTVVTVIARTAGANP